MGFMDKIKAKLASLTPDTAGMLSDALGSQDSLLAHALVTPSGFTAGGGRGLLNAGVNVAVTAVNKSRHIGGREGSIARSLPTDGDSLVLALTRYGYSIWDFGMGRNEPTDKPVYRVSREHIASLTDTGGRAQGGGHVWRFTFVDGSFFDFRVHAPSDGWDAAAAGMGVA